MSGGLRDALGLPEVNVPDGLNENGEFRQDFRAALTKLNQCMQLVAVHGAPGEHQSLDTNRQNLIKAYQTANSIGDPAKNSQVLGAAAKIEKQTSDKAAKISAGNEEWQERQPAFVAAVEKIGELEDANHPNAAAYRKLTDAIQARINGKDYQNAKVAFDQLQPALNKVLAHLTVSPATGDAPGGGGTDGPGGGHGPSGPSKTDAGTAKTQANPLANTVPVQQVGNPPKASDLGSANTIPAAPVASQTGSGDGTTALPPSRGDGQPVQIKQAFDVMRKNGEMIRSSASHSYHLKVWQEFLGNKGEPPVAFKYSGRIQIDVDKLTTTEHQQWLELDKAKNPGRYVKDEPAPTTSPKKSPEKSAANSGGSGTVFSVVGTPQPQTRPWNAKVSEISPQTALQRSAQGTLVHASASAKSHQQVWSITLGQEGKAPLAFSVDNAIYVDMRRWPKDMPPPNIVTAGGGADPRYPQDAYNKAGTPTASTPTTKATPVQQSPVNVADDARAEATKLRSTIESQRKQLADQLERMRKIEPELTKKADAATGDEKVALIAKQTQLAKGIGDAERAMIRAKADLDAIDNPATKREELLGILARQKAGGTVSESTEITSAGLDPYKKGKVNKDVTATTTSYSDGKATTESNRSQQKVGLDGYTKSESSSKSVTDGQTTKRSSDEKKTNVSLTGKVSAEQKKSVEVQNADGSKAAVEVKNSKEISTKGASQSQTATITHTDGSSVSKTSNQAIERGDGKIIGTTSSSVTKTDASGTATTTDKSASGGIVAGKDGLGFKGGAGGGKSVTSTKGRHAGASLNISANVTCKIGDPKGEPKLYPVTVTVSFGVSGSVSAGAGKKEDSKYSGSVEAKKSREVSMVVTHHLGEAELADYTKTLEAASKKGSKVAATKQEFAIISAGVNQSWEIARQMWEAGGGKLSKDAVYGQKQAGDSIQVSEKNTDGIAVKGKVYGGGIGYGQTNIDETTRAATRNEKGQVDLDSKHEKGKQTDLSASLDVGVVGVEVGTSHVHKTRFGYSFEIDPKNDPDGKILDHFNHCTTEQEYLIFRTVYQGKVKLIGKMQGQTDAEGTNVGVSIGPVKGEIGTKQSVDREEKTDAKGKVIGRKTTGTAGAGGQLGGWADSKADEAAATTDSEGNASLTLSSSTKKNYGSQVREKERKKLEEKLSGTGKASGALTDAAGGDEDDTAVQDVSGIKLSNKDLRKIGGIAVRSIPAWMGLTRRWQEDDDWKTAGIVIRMAKGSPSAVAHALAEFIGGDRVERLETVRLIARGGYHATMGKAFEFPDSIRDIRADYDLVTDENLTKKLYALEKKEGTAAVTKEGVRLLAIVDRITPRIQACHDFENKATKTEMLSELNKYRTMLNQGNQRGIGNSKPEDDPKVLEEEASRLLHLCYSYGNEQRILVAQLDEQSSITVSERMDGIKLIKQLEDLHYRWWSEYYRLKENYSKRKVAMPASPAYNQHVPQFMPTESLVAKYEKIFRR